nr:polyprotein [Artichoke Italian latent virus]
MGFREFFASSHGQAARGKAALNRGLSGWVDATLTTVRSAAPDVQVFAYSALWSEIDSVQELVPLTPAMLLDQLRADLICAQVRGQNCTPACTSRLCSSGGLPVPGQVRWEDDLTAFEDCPAGRNVCRAGIRCKRHHGPGQTLDRVQVYVEAPKCPRCQGTGIIPRSEPLVEIRSAFEKQAHFKALRPSKPLHEWILEEGAEKTFARRRLNWIWTSRSETGTEDEDACDASTWMAAAQILFDDPDAQVYYPGTTYKVLRGGSKGYDDWCTLPPSRDMCNRLFDLWHRKNTPDYSADDTLGDFSNQRMGTCYLRIARSSRIVSREWYGRVASGDFAHFEECCSGLRSPLEEFLDVFYDCAAQFDGEIELFLDANDRAYRARGQLGGVQELLITPAVCPPARLLPEIGESDFDQLEDETLNVESQIPPLFRDNGLSALYANLVLKQAFFEPTLMAHPDHEEIEDQRDHLENKQGGEIVTTPGFIKMLKDKRKEVRGKEFAEGSEGRLVRSSDLTLSKDDVFLSGGLFERFRKSGIVQSFKGKDPKLTKVCVDLTNSQEIIKYPVKEMCSDSSGIHTGQVFTVLNRPLYNALNKLAESGWKEANSVCLNSHIRSYVPVQTPLYAFCVIMWGHSSDAEPASLCGAGVYLGDQEAAVLELPLVCSYLGNSLQDFDAYKPSLVLSTVFFGKSGLSAGQNVFGITAIEFTEYMPTSYGGITHERDSWQAMLRNHQGKDKGRFIAGFNVVDALERDKEEPIKMPSFDLEPVPRTQPIVRTFTGEGKQPLLNKSRSMRIQSFSSFRGGNIPVGRRVDNTTEAINYELGRASTSSLNSRLDACNLKANGDFAFSQRITYPAAATVGTVIGTLDVFTLITTTNSRVCAEWLERGYVDRNILMISHLSTSPYLGMAIWYVFDAYGHIPADVTTTVELESIRHLSPHVHILKDSTTSTWTLTFHREGGQSLNFAGSGFMKPKIWIIAASSAQMPCSADVQYLVEGYATGESFVRGLATEKVLTYPVEPTHLADLDLLLAPQQLAIGTTATTNFPLSLAEKSVTLTKRETYSYAAGLLSHFLGIGGKLRFSVHSTSSCFVTCKLRVFLWGTQPTTVQTAQIPHVDFDGAGTGELLIQSAFYTTANFGDSGARFWIMPLSAPAAPQTVETKFEFYIRILGIDVIPDLCRQINYKQRFGWFMISPSDTTTSELHFKIPSRIGNISVKNTKCVNFTNAFAIMCAPTGMHWGRCILHFTWSWHRSTEAGKMKGDFAIQTGMGNSATTHHLGDTRVFSVYDNAYSIPFEFGSFAGPLISGGTPNEAENWVRVYSTSWQWIHAVTVSIEVLPGFRFYGRSAGPMTIPS